MGAILLFFYGKILIAPNQILFNASGDGLKNYYVPMMQLESDQYFTFEYFNYPYGEHFFYTDGFPLLVLVLKPVALIYPEISSNIPGIINFTILLSFVFCALFLYLIFSRLKLPELLAILFAIGITMLQPQLFRATGHFTLAYCHIIPLSFWLVLKFIDSESKLKYSIFMALHNIAAILIHPYLGLMAFASTIPVIVVWMMMSQRWKNWKNYFYLLLQSFFPPLFYQLIIVFTDQVADRNKFPQGFHENQADFVSVFFPSFGPFSKWFNFEGLKLTHNWEGISYIGLATTILLVPVLLVYVIKIFMKKESNTRWIFLIGLLLASSFFLCLSMGYPFTGRWYETYQKIPFLREFRALGRFTWVFYYSSTIFIALASWSIFERFLNKKWKKYSAIALFSIIPVSYAYESFQSHQDVSKTLCENSNYLLPQNLQKDVYDCIHHVNSNEYQAILPIPYFYVGTEIFDVFGSLESQKNAILVSQQLKMPLLSNYSARSSFEKARKVIRIISNNIVYKDISDDIENKQKPFLIVLSNENLSENESRIVNQSTLISKCAAFSLYRISFDDLFKTNFIQFPVNIDEYYTKMDWLSLDSSKIVFADDFENRNSKVSFTGKSCYSEKCLFYHVLYEFPDGLLQQDSSYKISFWINNSSNPYKFAKQTLIAFVNRYDTIQKITSWEKEVYPIKSTLSNKDWTLVEMQYTVPDNHSKYSIVLKGNDSVQDYVYIDNLLILKKGGSAYKILNDSMFLWNNYVQKKSGKPFIYK